MRRNPSAVLGIDAAWTPRNTSGVALLATTDRGWHCLRVAPSFAEFVDPASRPKAPAPVASELKALLTTCSTLVGDGRIEAIAVDMPLAHTTIEGRRHADDRISSMFGHCNCAVHSPNPERPGMHGRALQQTLVVAGYPLVVFNDGARPALIEVYPHVALLGLMSSSQRLPYKAGKTRTYWKHDSLAQRKNNLVGTWAAILDRLRQEIAGIELRLPSQPEHAVAGELKRIEDSIDALVCAWMAAQDLKSSAVAEGDENAAIWIPNTALPFAKQNHVPH